MPEFTDAKGDVWNLSLTLAAAERIDASDFAAIYDKPVSILAPDQEFFTDALTNTPLVLAMVWAVIKPQADAKGIDENELKERLDGAAIAAAKDGFWGAVADFFPERATVLSQLFSQYKNAETRMVAGLEKMAGAMGPGIDQAVDRELATLQQTVEQQLTDAGTRGAMSG